MTDKELIRYAAKAAGVKVLAPPPNAAKLAGLYCWVNRTRKPWNPLADDGDALRLAVKLRIDVTFNEMDVFAFPQNGMDGCSELVNVDDSNAATRRVITRAAAEIGWAMP